MLNRDLIEYFAKEATRTANHLLRLKRDYSIRLIENPNTDEDGIADMHDNVVMLNLAILAPHRVYDDDKGLISSMLAEIADAQGMTPEQKLQFQEDHDHAWYTQFVVYHEMRHLYQGEAIQTYLFNKRVGEKVIPQKESDKTCERWISELRKNREDVLKNDCGNSANSPAVEQPTLDIEADADAFAIYLLQRTYRAHGGSMTNRRIGIMKRRYNRIPLPQDIPQENAPNQVGTMDDHCA